MFLQKNCNFAKMRKMAKKKANTNLNNTTRKPLVRRNRVVFMLNDEEQKAINRFVAKYKIQNKSKWMRETIMSSIFRQLSEDYPSLFD